jgi:hypothetical protein
MPSLQEIEHEIGNILAVTEELDEESQPEAMDYLQELSIQEEDKIDAITYVMRRRQADIEFLKEEERRMKERRQSMERRLSEFKDYLCWIMRQNDLQRLRGRKGTIYIRTSTSTEVTNIADLPSEYVETRVDYKPLKSEINEAIKEGHQVPGVRVNSKQSVVIR